MPHLCDESQYMGTAIDALCLSGDVSLASLTAARFAGEVASSEAALRSLLTDASDARAKLRLAEGFAKCAVQINGSSPLCGQSSRTAGT